MAAHASHPVAMLKATARNTMAATTRVTGLLHPVLLANHIAKLIAKSVAGGLTRARRALHENAYTKARSTAVDIGIRPSG
jgi:hypothetical protein